MSAPPTVRTPVRADAEHDVAARTGLPRPVRIATIAVAALTIAAAAVARLTGSGHVTLAGATPVAARALRFVDRADGGIDVRAADGGAPVARLAPGTGGFVRGALRGLARGRRARGVGDAVPFVLTRWNDGRLTLDDRATAAHVELDAFGATNAAAFAALLPPAAPAGRR